MVEGARLEIVCTFKKRTEGSNPSLSAILKHCYGGWCRFPRNAFVVNPVRSGRKQRQQRMCVPGCGWRWLPPSYSLLN